MARVVDFDLTERPRGRKAQYPWEEWFDGQTRELVNGEDYEADSPKSFRSTVYSAAKRNGVRVRAVIIDGHLHVQALDPMKPKTNGHAKKRVVRRPGD